MNNKLKDLRRTANNNHKECETNARQFYVNTGHIRQRQALYNGCDTQVDNLYGINVTTFNPWEPPPERGGSSAGAISSLAQFQTPCVELNICKPHCFPDSPPEAPGFPLDPSYHLLCKYPSPSQTPSPTPSPKSAKPQSAKPQSAKLESAKQQSAKPQSAKQVPGNDHNVHRAPTITSSRVSSKTDTFVSKQTSESEATEPRTTTVDEEEEEEEVESIQDIAPCKEVEIVEACPESCLSGKISVCMRGLIRWTIFIITTILIFIGLLLFMCHNCTSHKAIVLIDTLLLFIKFADVMCYHL